MPHRNPLRYLQPLALIGLILLVVVLLVAFAATNVPG